MLDSLLGLEKETNDAVRTPGRHNDVPLVGFRGIHMAECDPETRRKFVDALSEWNIGNGGIRWDDLPAEWLNVNLPGLSQRYVGNLMYDFVMSGGKVDQTKETRERWKELHDFHYDLRMEIDGCRVYIETRLIEDSRISDPYVHVVNMHPQ